MRRFSLAWRRKGRQRGVAETHLHLAGVSAPARRARKSPPRRVARTQRSRDWIWPAIGFLVFVEVLLLGGHAVRWARSSEHFALRELLVRGQRQLQPADIRRLVGIEAGSNIFDADLQAARARVASHPWIKLVDMRLRPPHALEVEVVERTPSVLIGGGRPLAVDEEGVVLGRLPGKSAACLPLIEGFVERRPRPGEVLRDAGFAHAMRAAFLFRDSPVFRGGCLSVRKAGAGRLRLIASKGEVEVMVEKENMESQAARLRVVAPDAFERPKFAARGLRFDLRFPDRVIVRPLLQDGGKRG